MRSTDKLRMRFRSLFRRASSDRELEQELRFHLDRQIAENIQAGMSPDEARLAALRIFGNPALLRDQARSTWAWNWIENCWRDFRYGLRTLIRTPGFALIAILVMALGIGANIALFTVVRCILLKPLPFRDPDRLFTLYEADSKNDSPHPYRPVDAGSFWEWQRATRDSAEMALISPFQNYNISAAGGQLPEKIDAAWASWNLFPILGVQPAIGRSFQASDDRPDAPATAMLTYSFWVRRFSADRSIVGKSIWLDARPYTVIGVLPESFNYSGSFGGGTLQVWTAVRHEAPQSLLTTYEDHEFLVIARLLHGTTLASLLDQLRPLQKRIEIEQAKPSVHDSATGRSMLDDAVDNYKTPLYALLAATGCVLLIACMNVASLLVARSASRSKELAIRTALGGGFLRLVSERLVESLIVSVAGGLCGLLLASAALQGLVRMRTDINRVEAIHLDATVAAFTVGIICLCAAFSGLITAFSVAGKRVLSSLQEASRAHSGGLGKAALRKTLLVLEVGLTVVLLVGAGLLLKSFQRLRNNDIGVPVDNALTMRISLPETRYRQPVQQVAFFEQLIAQVRAVPGVQSAGLVTCAPGEGWGGDHIFNVVEHPEIPAKQLPDIMVRGAEPGYFAAIQLPLIKGRIFTSDERLQRANVVLLSQSAANAAFPGEDPIGKHLRVDQDGADATPSEVIGVVGDTRWVATEDPRPTLYWPIYGNGFSNATIVLRSDRDVRALAMPVQKVVGHMDSDLPVSDVMTLREAIGKATIDSQFDALLVVVFAVIAVILAAAGLYGVLAYLVTLRTNEIGVRIALGARREQVLRLTLVDGLRPALIGLLVGLAGSAATVRLIRSMLYQTEPLDPAVFSAVAIALLIVAAMACVVPSWRASRLDPVKALRTE